MKVRRWSRRRPLRLTSALRISTTPSTAFGGGTRCSVYSPCRYGGRHRAPHRRLRTQTRHVSVRKVTKQIFVILLCIMIGCGLTLNDTGFILVQATCPTSSFSRSVTLFLSPGAQSLLWGYKQVWNEKRVLEARLDSNQAVKSDRCSNVC